MAFTPKYCTPKGPMMKAYKTPVPSTPRVSLTQDKRRDITLQVIYFTIRFLIYVVHLSS